VAISCRFGKVEGYTENAVKANINAAIAVYFLTLDIGDGVDFGDLNLAVGRAAGVDWIDFDAPTEDLVGVSGTLYIPGAVTLTLS
jgi:hypothetical protein